MVEHFTCNEDVAGSIPASGSVSVRVASLSGSECGQEPWRLSEFQKFVLRGNVVDLAVAIVVGVAFAAMITALVGDSSHRSLRRPSGKSTFNNPYSTVVFFAVVLPLNALMRR